MGSTRALIWCLAFSVGLLMSELPWGGWIALAVGIGCEIAVPRIWRLAPQRNVWLVAGAIALLASFYISLRTPHPGPYDISRHLPTGETAAPSWVQVQGWVEGVPRQTRSGKAQFWLTVRQVDGSGAVAGKTPGRVGGKLYVTVPLLQGTGIYPGTLVSIQGSLYKPMPATNPDGFDFQRYLAQEGCFAGLRGQQVDIPEQKLGWGLWKVQRQIVRSLVLGAGSPAGQLISSMALGKEAVDLPYDIKDAFSQVGLAHALAASGFQISLILGVALALTRRFSERVQVALAAAAIVSFVTLAGFEPAILRAAFMGFATLLAMLLERKSKPLGSLVLAAVVLLLWNPLWIWDLGFQFSFLATLGLLVTVPTLTRQLDWLPSAIAPLVAVPIAAYLWTLPLQLHQFGVVSPYSIPVNILAAPLISILSLGGMISAIAALIWSPAGSAFAFVLNYPAQGLLGLVQTVTQLPGNIYAVGAISVLVLLLLYGLLGLTGWHRWWRSRWWVAVGLGAMLVMGSVWQTHANLLQASILATTNEPVLLIQDAGKTALVNSSRPATTQLTLLPFLQKQGINHLDWAIAASGQSQPNDWATLQRRFPIKTFYQHPAFRPNPSAQLAASSSTTSQKMPLLLSANQPVQLGSTQIQLVNEQPALVSFTWRDRTWLWLDDWAKTDQTSLPKNTLPRVEALWWNGKSLPPDFLTTVRPTVAIASARTVDPETTRQLDRLGIQLYYTGRDGAIQWTPTTGFKTTLNSKDGREF